MTSTRRRGVWPNSMRSPKTRLCGTTPKSAQKLMRERTALEDRLGSLAKIERELDDAATLVELGEAEGDEATEAEGVAALKALKAEGERRQLEALLSGEADANDSYVEVHAGAGGTESCDWARMLLRMYVRWAERRKFEVEVIEETTGTRRASSRRPSSSGASTPTAG